MNLGYRILSLLADGRFHSGEELGTILGIGRSAVWKVVQSLEAYGVDIFAVRGKGYRLAAPLELLEPQRIVAALDAQAATLLRGIEVLREVDSTNHYLTEQAGQGAPDGYACFSEYQSLGRGRRGRTWVSPFGTNIYMSVLSRFDGAPEMLQGLSLAIGVAAVDALSSMGAGGIGLKWPNDLLWEGRKLGGILLETAGEFSGPWQVVTGIGINLGVPRTSARQIDQPWVDLRTIVQRDIGRNQVAGRLLQHTLTALEVFKRQGFIAFRRAWEARDVTRDRHVSLSTMAGVQQGIAQGVDDSGALILSVQGKPLRFMSGDLSLRIVA